MNCLNCLLFVDTFSNKEIKLECLFLLNEYKMPSDS